MAKELDVFQQILADERLASTIDTLPFWKSESSGVEVNGEATEHLLSASGVSFRLTTYSDLAYLSCYSIAPNYLELERGQAGIEDLQHFMMVDLPRLFYDLEGFVDEQRNYRENSFLSFTSRENENDALVFQIQSDLDRAKLLEAYSGLDRANTKMVSISATRGYEHDRKKCRLNMKYSEIKDQPDKLTISLPMNESGIHGWTTRAASWMLRNHIASGTIDDLDLAANQLSGTVRQIATRVFLAQR